MPDMHRDPAMRKGMCGLGTQKPCPFAAGPLPNGNDCLFGTPEGEKILQQLEGDSGEFHQINRDCDRISG